MIYQRFCKQCGDQFYSHRSDAAFCSAKCTAQFYRDNPNPDYIHAEKDRVNWYTCDHCGKEFVVNDYAKREGARRPRFCSNKCKQAAYRQRVSDQAARRSEQETRPGGESPRGDHKKQGDSHKEEPKRNTNGQGQRPPNRKGSFNPFDVMGLRPDATAAEIKRKWRELCHLYHPDKNPGNVAWATERMQEINRAYEMLKKS